MSADNNIKKLIKRLSKNTYVYTNSSISHKNIIRSLSCILCCAVPCQAYQMISPMSCWCVFSSEYSFIYCTCSASMESFFHSFQSAASKHTYACNSTAWPPVFFIHLLANVAFTSSCANIYSQFGLVPTYIRTYASIDRILQSCSFAPLVRFIRLSISSQPGRCVHYYSIDLI